MWPLSSISSPAVWLLVDERGQWTAQLVTDALVMAIWRRGKTGRAAAFIRPRRPIHQ